MRYLGLFKLSSLCVLLLVFGASCNNSQKKESCQKKVECPKECPKKEHPKPKAPEPECPKKVHHPKPPKVEPPPRVCPEKKRPLECPVSCCWNNQTSECTPAAIQIRGAAFLPLNKKLRDVYGTALPTLEVEGSYSVLKNMWATDQLLVWGNVGWTTKTGKTIGFGYYTKLNLIPFTAGLEYQVHIVSGLDFYLGTRRCLQFTACERLRWLLDEPHPQKWMGIHDKARIQIHVL